ncbi:hypothetical protein [Vibrio sp. M260118]|uniref:hypothetical protein n=1 Tax=Vibrio sp. M260118 TaxID=3020896 RepID=UPI002F40BB3F
MNFKTKLQEIAAAITGIKADKSTPIEQRAKQLAEANAMRELLELEQAEAEYQAKIDALIGDAQSKVDKADTHLKRTKAEASQVNALAVKANEQLKELIETLEAMSQAGNGGKLSAAQIVKAWKFYATSHHVADLVNMDSQSYNPHFGNFEPIKPHTAYETTKATKELEAAKANLDHVKANADEILNPAPVQVEEKSPIQSYVVDLRESTHTDRCDEPEPHNHTSGKPARMDADDVM